MEKPKKRLVSPPLSTSGDRLGVRTPFMELLLKYFSDFSDEQLRQLYLLEKLYKEWNDKINVISRKDIDSLYEKHVLHSLSIAAFFDQVSAGFTDDTEIMDLGTGGGFPGLPLAIYFPHVKFHLVDSISKKLKVVEAIAEATGIKNITTQHVRAEDIGNSPKDSVRKFDYIVSRAVAPLKDLWRWSKPLLRHKVHDTSDKHTDSSNYPPGLICLKGGDLATEIKESGTNPQIIEIVEIFPEDFFKDKKILFIPR